MELEDYFTYAFPILIFELASAIAGLYYLKKNKLKKRRTRLLVYFLVVTFVVEFLSTYAVIGYFSEYKYFSFIKDSLFRRNTWIFNIYTPISVLFFCYYFMSYVANTLFRNIFKISLALFFIGVVVYHYVTNEFFENYSSLASIIGAFLIISAIALFFFELLKTDLVLSLNKYLPFYIALGVLVFNLSVTPIFIFSDFFSTETGNFAFIKLQLNVLLYSNIFMYSCFILGFLICSKKKKYS